MNMKKNLILAATLAALTAGAGLSANATDKTFLTMDSFPAGTAAGQFGIAFSQVVQKNLPVEIQVTIGKPATKSAIDAAKGKVDLILTAPAINFLMKKNLAMYKKVKDAPQLVSKLRGFVNYPLGPYHIIVYEDSGIKTLADLKGKKVFLGPPAGAATNTAKQIVAAATGMKPGEDFEVVRFDWKSAETAFLDRQMDAYFIPTTVPSASIEQFSLVSKIRILGIPDDVWDTPGMKKVLALPGRTIETIPAGVYKNQANEGPVKSVGGWVGIGSNMDMDATLVYNMTKAFWDNIAEIHRTAEWMKVITLKTALNEMNIPLHAGAYRYYKEVGVKIPDALIPPEAK